MLVLYAIVAALILVWTTAVAVGTYQNGWHLWAVGQGTAPVLWLLACSAVLRVLPWRKLSIPWKVSLQTLLVTVALVGAVFGQVLSMFFGLGVSYGAHEPELAQSSFAAFGLGGVLAIAPGLLAAGIAALVAAAGAYFRENPTHMQE